MPQYSRMPSNRKLRDASEREPPWYKKMPPWIYQTIAGGLVMMLGLIAMASYAWGNISRLNLPVSPLLSIFAVVLPVGNFISISHALFNSKGSLITLKSFRTNFYLTLLLILDTILASIAAVHLPPEMLNCHLTEGWRIMWRGKDSKHIKIIQDALNCCGFMTTKDMAYPFPTKDKKTSCAKYYSRDHSCLVPWRKHGQTSASLYLAVGLILGLTKLVFMVYINQAVPKKGQAALGDETGDLVEEIESDHHDISQEEIYRSLGPIDESTGLLDAENNGSSSSQVAGHT